MASPISGVLCPGSQTRAFEPVPRRVAHPVAGYYNNIAFCSRCGRMVCLTDGRKLYRHNMSGRDSSWVQWVERELERATP